ncbi:MAG: hypothetical protein ACK45G_04780, partial [Bacteroidota bacterium]
METIKAALETGLVFNEYNTLNGVKKNDEPFLNNSSIVFKLFMRSAFLRVAGCNCGVIMCRSQTELFQLF